MSTNKPPGKSDYVLNLEMAGKEPGSQGPKALTELASIISGLPEAIGCAIAEALVLNFQSDRWFRHEIDTRHHGIKQLLPGTRSTIDIELRREEMTRI